MFRIRPYSAEEWAQVEKQGFARFYITYTLESLAVFIFVFAVIDFLVYFDRQTDLMLAGVLSAVIFAPTSTLFLWYSLNKKFRNPERRR